MFRRILRPRVLIYSAVLLLLIAGLLASLWFRTPFRVDVMRDNAVLGRLSDDGMLENVYRMQIMNGTEETQHYRISATGLKGLEIDAKDTKETQGDKNRTLSNESESTENSKQVNENDHTFMVKPTESRWVIVALKMPDGTAESGSHKIQFVIEAIESKEIVTEKSVFLVPR